MTEFGERVQAARLAKGLSQGELAELAGVNVRTLQNWECGHRDPKLDWLVRLAAAVGMAIGDLLPEKPPEPARKRGRPRKGA